MPKSIYVVVGASGGTGTAVTRTLLARGANVRAVARNAAKLAPLAQAGAEAYPCDVNDREALTRAFEGAAGVYLMTPPDPKSPDYLSDQQRTSDSLTGAFERSGIPCAVLLSSLGADRSEGTGPVVGLHRFEEKLRAIPGRDVLSLRAAYFMENTLMQINVVRMMSVTAGPLRADLRLPMIATGDIGARAGEALFARDFKGFETRELLGERDLSMTEAAEIIGAAIGSPGLGYIQLPDAQLRLAMPQMGISENMADLLLEMSAALNSGHMRSLEERNAKNTTPTSFETFVAEEFLPKFGGI